MIKLRGVVERITYQNPENGWSEITRLCNRRLWCSPEDREQERPTSCRVSELETRSVIS